ncbi:MAG TPA: hypothetical protein VER11_06735 [Polyangiaceae bacterium]|nr:hypothetical protein [Polyangiaceae bacterium]
MSELGPRAREILRSGRELNRPTDADRERIDKALSQRLGAALLLTEPLKAPPAIRPRWPFVTSGVIGAGLVGGAIFLATRSPPVVASAPPAVVSAVAVSSAASPAPVVELPVPQAPEVPKALGPASSERPAVASARPAEDRLAQEVALLARATSSLHAGRPADALKTLDEYQRRFPNGKLTEERRAARAQALCALGRQGEAESELARLAPKSLAAARARQVCESRAALKK